MGLIDDAIEKVTREFDGKHRELCGKIDDLKRSLDSMAKEITEIKAAVKGK